jgi:hypothetical protein
MNNTENKIRYSNKDIFIGHPLLLQKKESKKDMNNCLPQANSVLVNKELEDNLTRRKSGKGKKCRRTRTNLTENDKIFSEFRLNNIISFYDEKDQKCVLKNNTGNLCNVFSTEQPKEIDKNYESMDDANLQMDDIGKNEFLMKEIGNKKHVDDVENTTSCIII